MAVTTRRGVVEAVLDRYPKTFAEEVGVRRVDTPAPLFRLLVLALLMSARIRADLARTAAAALFRAGWRTPARMAEAAWDDRARTLNQAGYARYDERTSTMLADTSRLLLDRYGGDLRRLRDEAGREPPRERQLLQEFKGIGDVGVDIFFRDVQAAWHELFPFADRRALSAAEHLGLGTSADELARLVPRERFVHLVNALVRVDLDDAADDVAAAAR